MDLRQEKQALSHSGRVLYLDVLRCAAIFAVVVIPGVSLLVFMLSWLCAKVLRRIPYVGYFCG